MREKLTPVMKAQLLDYCKDIGDMGGYWGNKEQFLARHKKIVRWVEEQEVSK